MIGRPPLFPADHDNETVVSVLFAIDKAVGGPGTPVGISEL